MGKRQTESSISLSKSAPPPSEPSPAPGIRRAPWVLSPWVVILVVLAVVACLASLFSLPSFKGTGGAAADNGPKVGQGDEEAAARWAPWTKAPDTAEERICVQFLQLKNAGDPAADQLLGPAPAVPAAPVSPEGAERLQTDFFLRQDFRVVGTGRDQQTGAPVLYTKGNVSAPTLAVKTGAGVETAQRTMSNPDLLIEVRDGRIVGAGARLHQ
jgi:hypothetical protein